MIGSWRESTAAGKRFMQGEAPNNGGVSLIIEEIYQINSDIEQKKIGD
jgi:hypothetical protein